MDYYDLGAYSRPVTTSSAEAQAWFDRGLNWLFGFNHAEAIKCFTQAVGHDPDCAMAHWGIAYAVGPNYNKAWEAFGEEELKEALAEARAAVAAGFSCVRLSGNGLSLGQGRRGPGMSGAIVQGELRKSSFSRHLRQRRGPRLIEAARADQ